MKNSAEINKNYTKFYKDRQHHKVYPTEFVVRTMLAEYPHLKFKKPQAGNSILDVAFGDGRNTGFLCDLGLEVSGIEISNSIVEQTGKRLSALGYKPDLRKGRNSNIPFATATFDYILACHCCYYCDEGDTLLDNLVEYQRVLKPGGVLIASVADKRSYIFQGAKQLDDGSMLIVGDPYGNRDGYRLHGFSTPQKIEEYFADYFCEFSFGHSDNDYYGRHEKLFWVVCKRK